MTPRSLAAMLLIATTAPLTAGCAQEPFEVRATSSVTRVGNADVLQIDVVTRPMANVRIRDASYAQLSTTTADANGVAVVRVPLPEPLPAPKVAPARAPDPPGYPRATPLAPTPPRSTLLGPEITLSVSVDLYEPRKVFKSRYRSAQTQLTVTRAPAVRYDPTTRTIACLAKRCSGTFSIYREARLDFSEIEPLATADFGGSKARTVTSQLSVTVDMRPHLEKVPLADLFKPYPMSSVDLPLVLGFADGTKLKENVNVPANLLRPGLTELLGHVAEGPVRFAGEEATGGNHTSLFFLATDQLHGRAATVRDIDMVAVSTDKERPGCGPNDSVTDAEVVVYERRTGKSLGHRRFPAASCKDDHDSDAAEAWVKTFVQPER